MRANRKNQFRSIRRALFNGRVVLSYAGNGKVKFLVKFFKPVKYTSGRSLTGEWYECTERYFERIVKNHPNYY